MPASELPTAHAHRSAALFALLSLSLLHSVVDTYAMLLEPLWPVLVKSRPHAGAQLDWLMAVAMLGPNFSQAVFGYVRDRCSAPWLLWAGPLLGVICLPLWSRWDDPLLAGTLIVIGMTGVGAFHPEAVTAAGTMLPEHRTRCISIFLLGGTVGLGLGPILSAWCVQRGGLDNLLWLIGPGVLAVLGFAWLTLRGSSGPRTLSARTPISLREFLRDHAGSGLGLLALSTCRVLPAVGMTKAVAFSLDRLPTPVEPVWTGLAQSVFLGSGSAGMLWLAGRFRPGQERATLISSAWLSLPVLLLLPACRSHYALFVLLLGIAGFVLNGTSASLISYGQQRFPHSAGIASALTMGLSWGCAGLVVAVLVPWVNHLGHPEWLFWIYALPLLLAGVLPWPRTELELQQQRERQ